MVLSASFEDVFSSTNVKEVFAVVHACEGCLAAFHSKQGSQNVAVPPWRNGLRVVQYQTLVKAPAFVTSLVGTEIQVLEAQEVQWLTGIGPLGGGSVAGYSMVCTPALQITGGDRFTSPASFQFLQAGANVRVVGTVECSAKVWGLSGALEPLMLSEAQAQITDYIQFMVLWHKAHTALPAPGPALNSARGGCSGPPSRRRSLAGSADENDQIAANHGGDGAHPPVAAALAVGLAALVKGEAIEPVLVLPPPSPCKPVVSVVPDAGQGGREAHCAEQQPEGAPCGSGDEYFDAVEPEDVCTLPRWVVEKLVLQSNARAKAESIAHDLGSLQARVQELERLIEQGRAEPAWLAKAPVLTELGSARSEQRGHSGLHVTVGLLAGMAIGASAATALLVTRSRPS